MQVSRSVLLATTTDAIERYEKARATYDEGVKAWKVADRLKRRTDALERQKKLRDLLSAGQKAKKPVTALEIEAVLPGRSSYASSVGVQGSQDPPRSFVVGGAVYKRPEGIPLADLKALEKTLESVLEDIISDGQLQRLGFKNMGWVFRAAMANVPAGG